ncbi:MAG: hypothetical protein FJ121_06335 [Deltaproteobacteria bacterium]|nr:hypothetical protein [Deltaproteobacteria bacterium]
MKKLMHPALLLAVVVLAANCGTAREQIRTQSKTLCEGIFCEVTTSDGPPPGYADVVIKASLKTHLPGEGALLESGSSPHGGPFYHFTVNVDGQAVTWKVPGQRENLPVVKDRDSQDEGDGMRYALGKKIRLRAGTHQIFLGVREKNTAKTVIVNLREGASSTLEFRPIYPRYKWGHPAFRLGFLGFSVWLDHTSIN